MFNLLVSYQGWPDRAGTIPTGRIYITSDEAPGKLFLRDGKVDLAKIGRIPTLLVTETGGSGPQVAKVAYITGITPGQRDTGIQYTIDSGIPPISNKDLEGFSDLLGVSKFNLIHTHWEIKDADLFKAIVLNQQSKTILPKVFSIDAIGQQDSELVSVMMPFSAEFKPVYAALKKTAVSLELECARADDIWEHHAVIQDIVNLIARARIVICDCSGRNPNVFYEIGIAHALGKEVILITQSKDDIPFDLRHLRYVHYLNNREGLESLSEAIKARIKTVLL